MHVVYKEMICDGAKSTLAKWNLISGIQFKPMKNYKCSCSALIWYVVIGLWTCDGK